MTPEEKLMERVKALLRERGQKALQISKRSMLEEKIEYRPLSEAVRFFMEEVWFDFLHPGLLSLSCEAVGGNPEETTHVGASMTLLAGAADIHDDIIDQSIIKGSKPTVFGKFGHDVAILAGDALFLKGLYLLHEASEQLLQNKKKAILEVIKQAFFDLSSAEAEEASFRRKMNLSGQEYFQIVKKKVAVAEATMKIGAILGHGKLKEIETLGNYGCVLGTLMTIRDEFIDVFEPDELKNRAEKECLPLPILFAFKDSKKKDKIIRLLKGPKITKEQADKIVGIVMDAEETTALKKEMLFLIQKGNEYVTSFGSCKETFRLLLESAIEDLE